MAAPNLGFTVDQRSVRQRSPAGIVGMIGGSPLNRVESFINAYPQADQVNTLTVSSFSVADYVFVVNGVTLTYTAIAGDTDTTGVATKIAQLINATPSVRGQVKASSAAAVVTLTSTYPGLVFTITEDDAKLTTASVTVAAQGNPLPCGRAVLRGPQAVVTNEAYTERLANGSVRPALTTLLEARIVTLTPTAANTTLYGLTVRVGDASYALTYTSDADATVQEIVEGLVASAPAGLTAAGVTPTENNTTLILTGTAGLAFDVLVTSGPIATAITAAGTDLARELAGITTECAGLFEQTVIGANVMAWPAEHPAGVLVQGDIMVECTEDVAPGDRVYVETAAGDATGRLYAAPSATRFLWPRAIWKRRASTSDDLAWIELR